MPLAIPYVAGPSVLATLLLLVNQEPSRWPEWLAALTAAWAASAAVLMWSGRVRQVLGQRGMVAVERLMGMVLVAIAVQMFLTGLELAFAMALIGVAGYAYIVGPQQAMAMLANDFYDSLESYSLTVVPLIVLMGQIAFNAGIAKRLYDSAHKFIGHIPGGLAMAPVAGATIFKALCGSIVATSATFASVAVPEMLPEPHATLG